MILTIPALPISWIETYTFLSYFSIFGLGMAILAMCMMFGYLGKKLHDGHEVEGDLKVPFITEFVVSF